MLFNEHQSRLWDSMLRTIADFRNGKIQYYDFVGALEGALDAGEFQDRHLIEQWYDYWTPLEVLRAQRGNNVTVEDVKKFLSNMELFLKSISYQQ